jgi:hypothetical protein
MRVLGLTQSETKGVLNYWKNIEKTRGALTLAKTIKSHTKVLLTLGSGRVPLKPSGKPYKVWKKGNKMELWGPMRPISRLFNKDEPYSKDRALAILKLVGLFEAPIPDESFYELKAIQLGEPSSVPPPEISERKKRTILYHFNSLEPEARRIFGFDSEYPFTATTVPVVRLKRLSDGYIIKTDRKKEYELTPRDHLSALDNCPNIVIRHYRHLQLATGNSLRSLDYYQKLSKFRRAYGLVDIIGSFTGLTKDRGMKTRTVTNIFRLLTQGMSRLHKTLKNYVESIPGVYIKDQQAGIEWVRSQQEQGVQFSSIDIDSATDNLPMEPQIELLLLQFPSLTDDILFFKSLFRGSFVSPSGQTVITYGRGNGQGIPGSFSSMVNFLINLILLGRNNLGRMANCGDDIATPRVQEGPVLYYLKKYGVPVSYDKSLLEKGPFAEFCGRIIHRDRVLRVYKGSLSKPQDDPLGLLRQYGYAAAIKLARKTHRSLIKKYVSFKSVATEDRINAAFIQVNGHDARLIHPYLKSPKSYDLGLIPISFAHQCFQFKKVTGRRVLPSRLTLRSVSHFVKDRKGQEKLVFETGVAVPEFGEAMAIHRPGAWIRTWQFKHNHHTAEQTLETLQHAMDTNSIEEAPLVLQMVEGERLDYIRQGFNITQTTASQQTTRRSRDHKTLNFQQVQDLVEKTLSATKDLVIKGDLSTLERTQSDLVWLRDLVQEHLDLVIDPSVESLREMHRLTVERQKMLQCLESYQPGIPESFGLPDKARQAIEPSCPF